MIVRLAVDTTVPIYALGGASPHREPCRALIRRAGDEEVHLEASISIVQEVAHVRARRTGDRPEASRQAARLLPIFDCHPVERDDVERALDLFVAHERLDMLDALHAASALNRGIGRMVSADRGFDDVPGLVRLDPAEAVTLLPGG